MSDKPVPPSVAEFTLQERAQMLATIALYETTAENCDVLRERLARYEDGEGNPSLEAHSLMTVAQHQRILAAATHPADQVAEGVVVSRDKYEDDQGNPVSTIAEQAREIAGLRLNVVTQVDAHAETRAELAALKAQPSGVVHHNLIEALKFYANGDHLLLADPDAWDTCSGEPINFLHDDAGTASVEDGSIAKAALDSLNSSPVSAGWTRSKPNVEGAYWVRGNGLEADALVQVKQEEGELWCNLHMCNSTADFDTGYTIEQLSGEFEWLGPLTVAALSAPSHGEQVRDGWKLVPVEPTREMISAASGAITTPDDLPPVGAGRWSMSDIAFRSRYRAALAAAPSAGSQGGDV